MVRLRVRDFELKNRSVHVYLKKQKRWHIKRLTPEVINAIELYIREYHLQPNDYFVGRIYKNGRYESTAISEIGYGKALQRWTGLQFQEKPSGGHARDRRRFTDYRETNRSSIT